MGVRLERQTHKIHHMKDRVELDSVASYLFTLNHSFGHSLFFAHVSRFHNALGLPECDIRENPREVWNVLFLTFLTFDKTISCLISPGFNTDLSPLAASLSIPSAGDGLPRQGAIAASKRCAGLAGLAGS
jgi:hypothetical protein